ncbi:helix-turn-helix domain-containing protein [Streptomyces abikoensis]|uniref:TetR/AcrR family transcriptional regulator n=1 Tax=Streptomyces abikoensis TaxID=97398 RepID=UPI0033D2FDDB
MTTGATERTHPEQRLLDTSGRLIPTQGIQAVGVEQLVTEAGVTGAAFYRHFSGKDGLVIAYLEARGAEVEDSVAAIFAIRTRRSATRTTLPHHRYAADLRVVRVSQSND